MGHGYRVEGFAHGVGIVGTNQPKTPNRNRAVLVSLQALAGENTGIGQRCEASYVRWSYVFAIRAPGAEAWPQVHPGVVRGARAAAGL